MAQVVQIVPKYSFPYVETVVNNYTVEEETTVASTEGDNSVKSIFHFCSGKGIDNVYIRKTSLDSFVSTYGNSNYKEYGQPLMMPIAFLGNTNSSAWCMRVMPEHATYAHNIFSIFYKADTAETVKKASERKFRIKLVQKQLSGVNAPTTVADLKTAAGSLDGKATQTDVFGNVCYEDGEGYIQKPLGAIYSAGRGKYGNNFRARISHNKFYEKEYDAKIFSFEGLSTENGLSKVASYIGSVVTSTKYNESLFINDVLSEAETGVAPIEVYFLEDNVEDVYDAYVEFCTSLYADLAEEYETELAAAKEAGITDAMIDGTADVPASLEATYEKLVDIQTQINGTIADNIPDLDEFDPIFGYKLATDEKLPFITYPTSAAGVDTTAEDYNALDYTQSNIVSFDEVKGVGLYNGSDGEFDANYIAENSLNTTVDAEIDRCYIDAMSGKYDKRILAPKRVKATALFDANYSMAVKEVLANLAIVRNDAILYLDCGLTKTLTMSTCKKLISDYAGFANKLISKNLHVYKIKENTTKKKVDVTITHFLATEFVRHLSDTTRGIYRPFVKRNCQLSGHVRDSLEPVIDDYETEIKELLASARINYFETIDENTFQRATQNTSDVDESDLTEESNVHTLMLLKRQIETDIQSNLYNFADASERKRLQEYVANEYAGWAGERVESFEINFDANEFEQRHKIMHVYLSVVFRGIYKRAVVEIDINQRNYPSTLGDTTTTEDTGTGTDDDSTGLE